MNLAAPQLHLEDREPPPFEVINPDRSSPFFLVCDHASNHVPAELHCLGLLPEQLELHIAYDIGSAAMTRRMAKVLGAPAVLAGFSRLVIDANRVTHHETSIPEISDGVSVPGNVGLDAAERNRRIQRYFDPYHQAVAAGLEAAVARGERPILVSMHSFTAIMNGFQRPWQVGVLWDKDDRIAAPLIRALAARGINVGDNQPYSGGTEFGFTMRHHAFRLGLPQILLEVRQDLISDTSQAEGWADLLMEELERLTLLDA